MAMPVARPAAAKPIQAQVPKPLDRQAEHIDIKSLTGKDLLKAPIAAGLTGTDAEVAVALRQILATRLSSYIDRKNERSRHRDCSIAIADFAPLWVYTAAPPPPAARQQPNFCENVAADGLDPEDYPVPSFAGDAQAQARAELALSRSVLTFARQASTGRVAFSRVSAAILFHPEAPNPEHVLAKLADSNDVRAALDSYNPPQAGYKALKAKLAQLRGHPVPRQETVHIPDGPILRPGHEGFARCTAAQAAEPREP